MTPSQSAVWNGPVGDSRVDNAAVYDRILEPLGVAALDRLDPRPGERVLDVGCGTGATTVEIGRRVGPGGSVVGVDVSRPMIDGARARLPADGPSVPVEFAVVDAGREALPGLFDAAFSRLGVMFFERPRDAFANIASALRPAGRLAFVCFQAPSENPFIMVPTGAALAHLDAPPMPPPGSPGPFSLADRDGLHALLESAGFDSVTVTSGPDVVTLGSADDLDEVARQALQQNPAVMAALGRSDAEARRNATRAATEALGRHVRDGEVRLGAGTWIVEARAAGAS